LKKNNGSLQLLSRGKAKTEGKSRVEGGKWGYGIMRAGRGVVFFNTVPPGTKKKTKKKLE